MKTFTCACGNALFFDSHRCLACGRAVGYDPDTNTMAVPEGHKQYCSNGLDYGVCNWLTPVTQPPGRCRACRLNQMVPDLTDSRRVRLWGRLEAAKRRLLYTLYQLELPIETNPDDPAALAFRFMADSQNYSETVIGSPVYTGHDRGVITINLREADPGYREAQREAMNEPYRTVLGHFRHESGHYFWDRLIRQNDRVDEFRALFGDETSSYEQALKNHYEQGPAADWAESHVSAYASAHPWEDWAESWAHYLHLYDGLETARAVGITLDQTDPAALPQDSQAIVRNPATFAAMVHHWSQLSVALNAMNSSMGLNDAYPFALAPPVVDKLSFIHRVIFDL